MTLMEDIKVFDFPFVFIMNLMEDIPIKFVIYVFISTFGAPDDYYLYNTLN